MTASPNRFEKHARTVLVVLWAATLVGGLALLEWVLAPGGGRHSADGESLGPAPQRSLVLREWRRNTDYRFAPTAERKLYAQGGLQDVYRLSMDSEGFIQPARRHQRPDVSIVFMGGSTTECLFVAPDNRFPHLAARNLEEALGVKVNGLNAGRSGNNSMHSLLLFMGKVVPMKPDFAVLMEAVNDIGMLSKNGTYWAKDGPYRIFENEKISVSDAASTFVKTLIPYSSQLFSQPSRAIRGMFVGKRVKPQAPAPADRAKALQRQRAMARDFDSSLRSFVRVAAAWGITPVLMTQVKVLPKTEQERRSTFLAREQIQGAVQRPEDFMSIHDQFNAIVREVARSEGAVLIDLAAARDWAFGDVYDAVHFTDHGSQQVADVIAAALKDHVSLRMKAREQSRQ